VTANDACCTCGGGYRGNLIGKRLLVGVINDSLDLFPLFVNNDTGARDGSIIKFIVDVADSLGVGLYATEQYSENATSKYPQEGTTSARCMYDIEYQSVPIDMCIGQFYKLFLKTNLAIPTESLFQSNIQFITPIRKSDYVTDYLGNIFGPFTLELWLIVAFCIFFAGTVLSIINRSDKCEKISKNNFFARVFDSIYESINGFVSLSPTIRSSPSAAEKVIVVGMILFSLLVVTAYTASLTSFLVLSPTKNTYESYSDVLSESGSKICVSKELEKEILFKTWELKKFLNPVFLTKEEMLDALIYEEPGESKVCNAALLSRTQYEIAVAQNRSYCDNSRLIVNDFDLSMSNVMYVSQFLGSRNLADITEWINMYIRNKTYTLYYHVEYYQSFKEANFDSSTYEIDSGANESGSASEMKRRKLDQSFQGSAGSDFFGTEVSDEWNFCTKSKSNQTNPMAPEQLYTPILLTLFCTMIGITLYIRERRKLKKTREFNKGNVDNLSLKDQVELEEYDICCNAKGMPLSKIVKHLEDQNVHNDIISKSIDLFPDTKGLMNLFVHTKLSDASRRYMELSGKGIGELYMIANELIDANSNEVEYKGQDVKAALDGDSPKDSLIELIITNESNNAVSKDEESAIKKDI